MAETMTAEAWSRPEDHAGLLAADLENTEGAIDADGAVTEKGFQIILTTIRTATAAARDQALREAAAILEAKTWNGAGGDDWGAGAAYAIGEALDDILALRTPQTGAPALAQTEEKGI